LSSISSADFPKTLLHICQLREEIRYLQFEAADTFRFSKSCGRRAIRGSGHVERFDVAKSFGLAARLCVSVVMPTLRSKGDSSDNDDLFNIYPIHS
jgi:hypothetical protein